MALPNDTSGWEQLSLDALVNLQRSQLVILLLRAPTLHRIPKDLAQRAKLRLSAAAGVRFKGIR